MYYERQITILKNQVLNLKFLVLSVYMAMHVDCLETRTIVTTLLTSVSTVLYFSGTAYCPMAPSGKGRYWDRIDPNQDLGGSIVL